MAKAKKVASNKKATTKKSPTPKKGIVEQLITIKSPAPKVDSGSGEKIKKRLIHLNFNLQIDQFEETVIEVLQNKGRLDKTETMGLYIRESSKVKDPSSWAIADEDVIRLVSFGLLQEIKKVDENVSYELTKLGKSIIL